MAKKIIISLFLLIITASCIGEKNISKERAVKAEKATGDIVIGAAAPWSFMLNHTGEMMWEGIEMAVNEVNTSGGVLGRKILIVKEDDEASVTKGRSIAQTFAENLDMVAVIGHYNSHVSIPASSIYESSGLLMLSPESTNPELTQQGFKYVFRNVPSDIIIGAQMADCMIKMGHRKVAIYYTRSTYGYGLANGFEDRFVEYIDKFEGVEIVDRISYDSNNMREFKAVLNRWKHLKFDAIFLVAGMPEAAMIITKACELGINVPFFGGDLFGSPELWKIAGKSSDRIVFGTFFHPDDPRPEVKRFNTDFKDKYGTIPDPMAAQGYDAVKLLVYAMKKAGTTAPDKVADILHSTKNWMGVTGVHTFDEKGDVVDKPVVKIIVKNGKSEYISETE